MVGQAPGGRQHGWGTARVHSTGSTPRWRFAASWSDWHPHNHTAHANRL